MATPTPTGTGTATPIVELDPEETKKSLNVSLADLSAKATALFAHKKYEEAAEVYGQAAEMQAEMNGEMNPENAEILFLYGRALFKVGQSKSDVLGGKAPEAKPAKPKTAKAANGSASAASQPKPAAAAAAASGSADKTDIKKPLFQFEGDENFEDSDEDEEAEGEAEEDEDDDDDLATAFEVLDLARVLFNKQLEALKDQEEEEEEKEEKEKQQGKGKGKEVAEPGNDSPKVRHIKERLADTHDLLAEISLENERYTNAITDSRASLKYKEELYPFESEIIAEAHFKLSLALEFASVTRSSDDEDAAQNNHVDQSLRDEAAAELEAAINSTKQKLQSKEVELATLHNPDDNEATRRQIADVKEVLADMEQRLVDLRKPPVDLNAALGIPPAPKPEVSEEVKQAANDLTGLVRKKRKADEGPGAAAAADEPGKKAREDGAGAS
ncbi:hypothetical protein VTJ83DRAFT_3573 [Remersonia thermophila]|uniref:Tetratricopeptide SHNi-TPR domain-containing protein n=1 Tax=Remersonia thermophila TaxID=72144 RepID=A0ABR4DGK4_9PEZI